jgi:hypothetical protein
VAHGIFTQNRMELRLTPSKNTFKSTGASARSSSQKFHYLQLHEKAQTFEHCGFENRCCRFVASQGVASALHIVVEEKIGILLVRGAYFEISLATVVPCKNGECNRGSVHRRRTARKDDFSDGETIFQNKFSSHPLVWI